MRLQQTSWDSPPFAGGILQQAVVIGAEPEKGPSFMRDREAASVVTSEPTFGVIFGIALTLVLLLGVWLMVLERGSAPSVVVNDHTDNAVPTVDLRLQRPPVVA